MVAPRKSHFAIDRVRQRTVAGAFGLLALEQLFDVLDHFVEIVRSPLLGRSPVHGDAPFGFESWQ
jgi:hypothetical protein